MAKKSDIRDRLGYRIQNLSNKMILRANRTYMEKFNVGAREWRVMAVLMLLDEGTAKEICDITLMDKANVSRAVRRLIQTGHLKEKPDSADKRTTVLVPTKKGEDLYYRIKKISDAREKKFMKALSPTERKTLPGILTKLNVVVDDLLLGSEGEE